MDKKLNNLIKKNLEELKAIDTKILDLSRSMPLQINLL